MKQSSKAVCRCDLHVHTSYSSDSLMTFQELFSALEQHRIDTIAVTDHNTIAGAAHLKTIAPKWLTVIVGEEIYTNEGEIIGLFLKDEIPPRLSPEETIRLIRRQKGIVVVPHPYDFLRKSALKRPALKRIADRIDLVEVFNSRTFVSQCNRNAERFAHQHHLPVTYGSDSHSWREIGNTIIEMSPFKGKKTFLRSLAAAKVVRRRHSIVQFFSAKAVKLIKRLGRIPPDSGKG
jgi:predicted metal-dependent phosphoesterase TrpH